MAMGTVLSNQDLAILRTIDEHGWKDEMYHAGDNKKKFMSAYKNIMKQISNSQTLPSALVNYRLEFKKPGNHRDYPDNIGNYRELFHTLATQVYQHPELIKKQQKAKSSKHDNNEPSSIKVSELKDIKARDEYFNELERENIYGIPSADNRVYYDHDYDLNGYKQIRYDNNGIDLQYEYIILGTSIITLLALLIGIVLLCCMVILVYVIFYYYNRQEIQKSNQYRHGIDSV